MYSLRKTTSLLAVVAIFLHLVSCKGQTEGNTSNTEVSFNPLDISFGGTGYVRTQLNRACSPLGLLVQSDGKIVVAGSVLSGAQSLYGLVRYNSDGTPDSNFGNSGIATAMSVESYDCAFAHTPDGKFILVGTRNTGSGGISVTRFMQDGNIDTAWGNNGQQLILAGAAYGVAVQMDSKVIVVGAVSNDVNSDSDYLIVRLNPDGSLDDSFGTAGVVKTSFRPYVGAGLNPILASARRVEVLSDGRIIVGGKVDVLHLLGFSYLGGVVSYMSDGSIDTSFGANGFLTGFGSYGDMLVQNDGKICISTLQSSPHLIHRFNPQGDIDTLIGDGDLIAEAPDGRIVSVSEFWDATKAKYLIKVNRYMSSGALDPSLTSVISGLTDRNYPAAVKVQADGKILVADSVNDPATPIIILRFIP